VVAIRLMYTVGITSEHFERVIAQFVWRRRLRLMVTYRRHTFRVDLCGFTAQINKEIISTFSRLRWNTKSHAHTAMMYIYYTVIDVVICASSVTVLCTLVTACIICAFFCSDSYQY